MDTNKNILKEFDYLKNEINQKIILHNNLLTFTITTVVAILSFALGAKNKVNPHLFLMPFCILIPMSVRISYYRFAMAKLSAYIIVFLEEQIPEIKWETRNYKVGEKIISDSMNRDIKLISTHYYECFVLCLLCYFLYIYTYCAEKCIYMSLTTIFIIVWPMFFVIFEGYITIKIDSIDKSKEFWIRKWEELKSEESSE